MCDLTPVAIPPCLSFPICSWSPLRLTPGSQLTLQDLAKFQPEVVDALEVPLGDYTLYSPPPPAGGAILSFILNVLRGKAPAQSPGPPHPGTQTPSPAKAQLSLLLHKPGSQMHNVKTELCKPVMMVGFRADLQLHPYVRLC